MCFSASASFGAGAVLTVIGFVTARKIHERSQLPLALFPFIFAVQQFSEGLVWLSLSNPHFEGWQDIPIYAFLIFSHIIWPVWIPLSILFLEKQPKRRKVLKFLLAAGITLALYHIYCLMALVVTAAIDGHHIQYLIAHPRSMLMPANILYALATIFSSFFSSIRRVWWLGLFIMISYIVAYLVYKAYIVSVWCYLATLLSIVVYVILSTLRRKISLGKVQTSYQG